MTAYAIINTGSKQYNVRVGDVIDVELLQADKDQDVDFNQVLFFSDGQTSKIGEPVIPNFSVKASVVGGVLGPKVIAYKYKKRKNYRRKIGHRQQYTRVKIKEFVG